ncbi:MAG: BT_3928 family protein [Muribaculaceae bacterium]
MTCKLFKHVDAAKCIVAMVWVLRLFVGAVFVLSGIAKAIDPWGTVYKLADYVGILGVDMLEPLVIFGAFALPVVEFLIGVFLLSGIYRRTTVVLLMAMMVVMTPLTLYLAATNRMVDCGCFGDVLVLSNWATFGKNVLLLAAAVLLCRYNARVKNLYGFGVQWVVWAASVMLVLALEYFGYVVQPLADFRPFKIGTSLYSGPSISQEDEDDGNQFVFIYSKNGVEREFMIDSLPDDTWEYVDRRVKDGGSQEPAVQYLSIYDSGFDRTAELLDPAKEQLIFTFPDFDDISVSYTYLINELNEFAEKRGVMTFGVTSGNSKQVEEWNDLSMAQYPIYEVDDTDMKMLVRGNPAVVYLKDGVIKWKRTLRSISSEALQDESADLEKVGADFNATRMLKMLGYGYIYLMIFLLFINRIHSVVKFTIKRIRKNGKKDVTLQSKDSETDNN